MAAIRIFSNFSNLPTLADFSRFVSAFTTEIVAQFNGNIEFVKNIKASGPYSMKLTVDGGAQKLTHSLGRVPVGYLLVYQDGASIIYGVNNSTNAWTSTHIFLNAHLGSSAVNVVLYVI